MKWLCGGPGNGWLYVRPDLAERLDADVHGLAGARAAVRASRRRWTTPTGATRFLTGTPNVPAHYAATAGYDLIEEIGVERIRENSLRQTQLLIDLADAAGLRRPEPARRRSGAAAPSRSHVPEFAGRAPGADGAPDPLRLPPRRRHPPRPALLHTDDELRFAIEQIGEIVETGAYERHLGAVARH